MLELIRMDLYRLRHSKSLLVPAIVSLALVMLTYAMISLVSDPGMLQAMEGQGAEITTEDYVDAAGIVQMTGIEFASQNLFRGGFWLVLAGFAAGFFAIADFSDGYSKNIFPLFSNTFVYAAARAVSMLVVVAIPAAANTLFSLVLGRFGVFSGVGGTALDWLWLFLAQCLTGWAFAMLMQFVVALLQRAHGKQGWMVAAIFVLACGAVPLLCGPLSMVLHMPWIENLANFTIFGATQSVTDLFTVSTLNLVGGVCIAWGVAYTALTGLALKVQDLA